VKDLRLFHDWNILKTVLVDHDVQSFYSHENNGIPIIPFYDYSEDKELLGLA